MSDKFWFGFFILFGFGLSAAARYFGVPSEVRMAALLSAVFVIVIGVPIGTIAGHFLAKDADVDTKGFKIIAWSGLIGWAIPVIGATLATMAYMFKRRSEDNQGFYNTMSNIAGLLAVTNAMIGAGGAAYGGIAADQTTIVQSNMDGALEERLIRAEELTGERSTERCQYAVLETWTREERDRYC